MIRRADGDISAFEFSVIQNAFRSVATGGLDESRWAAVAECMVKDVTGQNVIDQEMIAQIMRKRK